MYNAMMEGKTITDKLEVLDEDTSEELTSEEKRELELLIAEI